MSHSLEIDSVILSFGDRVILSDVYLRCQTGRITGLFGRNGTGKSCLMNIITGELKCDQSFIRIDDRQLTGSRRSANDLVYLPQYGFLPKGLTIGRIFIDYNLIFSEFTIYFPEFAGKEKLRIRNLSGGERRIIEVYIVVRSAAKFALLDEPFSHIMPKHIENINEIIQLESSDKGILISDHMFRNILGISDDIYLVHDRQVEYLNDPEELVSRGYANFL